MDDALVLIIEYHPLVSLAAVLILVLMDDALVHALEPAHKLVVFDRLNPCFNG